MDKNSKPFLEWVQVHEREWGTETYSGRPTLQQLLHSPIVVMWSTTDKSAKSRFVFSAHENGTALNEWATGMLTAGKVAMPGRKIAKIFVNQTPVKFAVRVAIQYPTE